MDKYLKKIAIIQLGKIEELLFTLPTISALYKKNENPEITLILSQASTSLDYKKENIHKIIVVDPEMPKIGETEAYDLLVNLTFTYQGAQLSSALESKARLGPYLNHETQEYELPESWLQYYLSVVNKTNLNPFHLVDIYKYIAQVPEQNTSIEVSPQEISSFLPLASPSLKIGYEVNKKWPIAHAIESIRDILNAYPQAVVFLLSAGTSASTSDGNEIGKEITHSLGSRCVDLYKQSTPSALMAICNQLDIVVGSCSLPIHLAAACNTLTITLDFFNQNLYQMGPYGHGHLLITYPPNKTGELPISSNFLASTLKFILSHSGDHPSLNSWKDFFKTNTSNAQVFLSQRIIFMQKKSQRVDLIYEPLTENEHSFQGVLFSIYRLVWQYCIHDSNDTIYPVAVKKESTQHALINLLDPIKKLYQAASFGIDYTKKTSVALKYNDLKMAENYSSKLQEVDDLIESLSQKFRPLQPICNFYRTHQFYNKKVDLMEQVNASLNAYETIRKQSLIIEDLIQNVTRKKDEKHQIPQPSFIK